MITPLLDSLKTEVQRQRLRFHVPAHAGNGFFDEALSLQSNLYSYDLTELPPLDVLGAPEGVLKASQKQVADLFGVQDSYYLVNGASTGIMAALLACNLHEGDAVLVARNCHRSVIHGLILTGAEPIWLLPQQLEPWGLWGEINPADLEKQLQENSQIKAFVMTHPTYEGIGSDINAIAAICHQHNATLIVDEAHGSLWPLSDLRPHSAITAGADAVIHSLHKSGGSLTQTALLHLPNRSQIKPEVVQQALNVLQTTSPSYIFLASLESTCAYLASAAGQKQIQQRQDEAANFRDLVQTTLSTIEVLSKPLIQNHLQIFIRSSKLSGEDLATCLEEKHDIAFEAYSTKGVLLLLNLGLPETALSQLQQALQIIDKESQNLPNMSPPPIRFDLPQTHLSPRKAFFAKGHLVEREKSIGRISKQIVASCPPGIPILIPGEIISEYHIPLLPQSIQVITEPV